MAITKIQTGGIPALAVTHDKLHTTMDLSGKTVTLPSAITDTITNKLPLAGGTMTGTLSAPLVAVSTSVAKMAEFNSTHTNHGYIVLKEDGTDKFYLGASTAVSGQTGHYTLYTSSGIGLDFNTGGAGSPRMRIDSSGNVGIGTTSPVEPLHVQFSNNTGADTGIVIKNTNTGTTANFAGLQTQAVNGAVLGTLASADYDAWGVGTFAGSQSNHPTYLIANNAVKMTILANGNVGIGTQSPVSLSNQTSLTINGTSVGRLDLQGTGQLYANGTEIVLQGSYGKPVAIDAGTNQHISFRYATAEKMRIDSSGRVLIGTTTQGQNQADNLTVSDAGNMGMTLRSTDSNECSIFFSDGTSGSAEYRGSVQYVHSNDSMVFGTAGVAHMRIGSSGNVGIGVLTPAQLLHVQAGSTGNGVIRVGGGAGLEISHDNSGTTIQRIDSLYRTTANATNLQLRTGTLTFHTGVSSTERMRIDSAGVVTTPYQPSFQAYRSPNSGWTVAASSVFIFNNTMHNIGGHYSTSNGRFTAPIAGTYQFSFHTIYTGNSGNDWISIRKNGARINGGDYHFSTSPGAQWDTIGGSLNLYLSIGDYVTMVAGTEHGYHGGTWSNFGCHLVG